MLDLVASDVTRDQHFSQLVRSQGSASGATTADASRPHVSTSLRDKQFIKKAFVTLKYMYSNY